MNPLDPDYTATTKALPHLAEGGLRDALPRGEDEVEMETA